MRKVYLCMRCWESRMKKIAGYVAAWPCISSHRSMLARLFYRIPHVLQSPSHDFFDLNKLVPP